MILAHRSVGNAPIHPAPEPSEKASTDPMARYAETCRAFRTARNSMEAFQHFAETSDYPALMLALRTAAVKLAVRPHDKAAASLIARAALALDIPEPDLLALTRVSADMIASGAWRPRSVNLDLSTIDASAKVEEAGFQADLNRWSHQLFPKTGCTTVPGLDTVYRAFGQGVHELGTAGQLIAPGLEVLAARVRGWSDALAADTQKLLRALRAGLKPSHLSQRDVAKLPPETQKQVLATAAWLSGFASDADKLVDVFRNANEHAASAQSPSGLFEKAKEHLSSGFFGLSKFLESAASVVRSGTDEKNWDTFSIHYLLLAMGLRSFGHPALGGAGTGLGVTFMFPTLEQFRREGRAQLRLVPNAWLIEGAPGGISLTSRGSEIRQRLMWVSAQVAEYEHHVTGGIPNMISMDFGEDYSYGPLIAFYSLIPIHNGGFLEFKVGGETRIFHPAFGPISLPTHHAAEWVTMVYDRLQQKAHRKQESRAKKSTQPAQKQLTQKQPTQKQLTQKQPAQEPKGLDAAAPDRAKATAPVAWPPGQDWRLAQKKIARSGHALETIERRKAEIAARSARTEPDAPGQLSSTERQEFERYLSEAPIKIRARERAIYRLADRARAGDQPGIIEARRALRALEKEVLAFEFADVRIAERLRALGRDP
ncbi:MAG: hypothetical protein IPK13_19595 [Deltaproteobacteria bacterium]|nr:hypothetical protein [Deltaproteobacteria bacterium]